MHPLVASLMTKLDESNIRMQKGQIICDLAGISFYLDNRDILGGVIQSWFGQWMTSKGIQWSPPQNTQSWPDFLLTGNIHLEVKCFNYDEAPGFDVANFTSYTNSLLEVPERLDDDYLVFGYQFDGVNLCIKDYWVKKVWELTGPSNTHFVTLQVKKNQPYNLRPKNWRGTAETFKSRKDFLVSLSKAREKFGMGDSQTWIKEVERVYLAKTRSIL